jgi:glycosyltransferase involved in cell wall biosynthesis
MISILIPVFNGSEFFNESYQSIMRQTFKEWELLIGINGHETDSYVHKHLNEIVQDNVKVKIYQYPNIRNKSATLNLLSSQSKYEILCLLDVDDIWHEEKLQHQIKFIDKFDVVGTKCRYFGERTNIPEIPLGEIKKEIFSFVNPIINSSSMFHKNDVIWDETIPGLEDYDYWLRLASLNKTFYNIDKILCFHRIHKSSFFNTQDFSKLEKTIKQKWIKAI